MKTVLASGRIACLLAGAATLAAGFAAADEPPRALDGRADLTGTWTARTLTPLERPASQSSLVMTEEEAKAAELRVAAGRAAADRRTDPSAPAPPQADTPGGYNAFWLDPGEAYTVVRGEIRSSGIVSPADGKIPYRDRMASTRVQRQIGAEYASGRGDYTGPEDVPLRERCLIGFGNTGGPGMLGSVYNNTYRFVQTSTHIMILIEMVHDARIVPIFDGPQKARAAFRPSAIAPWLGDSVGWWEGDTFVMETTNVHPAQAAESSIPLTPTGKVIERFTRLNDGEIAYTLEVDDPNHYTTPWKAEYTFTDPEGEVYEYACHEGNYAMAGILGGARRAEREAAQLAMR